MVTDMLRLTTAMFLPRGQHFADVDYSDTTIISTGLTISDMCSLTLWTLLCICTIVSVLWPSYGDWQLIEFEL